MTDGLGGWIDVLHKLPKEGVPVQVYGKIPYGRNMMVLVAFRTYDWEQEYGEPIWKGLKHNWSTYGNGLCGIRDVIAWKPLSLPPNAELTRRSMAQNEALAASGRVE